MRWLAVNHAHPGTAHVSGMRVHAFAEALARAGHQVVLVTSTLNGAGEARPVAGVARDIAEHDWRRPYHLACPPRRDRILDGIRAHRFPPILRKALVLGCFLLRGGVFGDWVAGTRPYWRTLAQGFQPELTWGTFGNTDTLIIAQSIARLAGVPWVMDVKDGWGNFLPVPLRPLLAQRFRDAAALTTNSRLQAERSRPWFPQPATVVYSGVSPCFLVRDGAVDSAPGFRFTLIGSVYSAANLMRLVRGFQTWIETRPLEFRRRSATFFYAGADHRIVSRCARVLEPSCRVEVHPYLGLEALAGLCRRSTVNAYLWTPLGFHHKLLELAGCGRPIIAFPGEHQESLDLAEACAAQFHRCADERALGAALEQIRQGRSVHSNGHRERLADFTWERQAERLGAVFERVARGAPRQGTQP